MKTGTTAIIGTILTVGVGLALLMANLHAGTEDKFDVRFESIEARFDGIVDRLSHVDNSFQDLNARGTALEGKLDKAQSDLQDRLDRNFDAINGRIDGLVAQVGGRGPMGHVTVTEDGGLMFTTEHGVFVLSPDALLSPDGTPPTSGPVGPVVLPAATGGE